jgi:hypothetical protein
MNNYHWDTLFIDLFDRCARRYRGGDRHFPTYYTAADQIFLRDIGYKPREFFDFVEDHCDGGEPTISMSILIASVRRDYLHWEMNGQLSDHEITPDQLPPKTDELAGFVWLPRILAKARGKLRGELHPEIMYGCGGDRGFLRRHQIAASDFLRAVCRAGDDDAAIVGFVRQHAAKA